jgi:hypothetical protein
MGAREDFMAVRQASGRLEGEWPRHPAEVTSCLQAVLRKAGDQEVNFIRLEKAGIQAEVIDLAYAVLGETRAEGPAVAKAPSLVV